jgi:hypothetical protein
MTLPPDSKLAFSLSRAMAPPAKWASCAAIPAILFLSVMTFLGCTGLSNPKPADDEIKKAIMVRGASNPLFGRIELESVEIEQIGNFNAEKKYWPVKARVTTKQTHQSAVLEYQIFRDDFGNWSARQANRS